MTNMKLDDFYLSFSTNEYEELKKSQLCMEQDTVWETDVYSRTITLSHLESPLDALGRAIEQEPGIPIPQEILSDTALCTSLLVNYNGKTMCLRECAIPSLRRTAGDNGEAFNRAKPKNIAIALTAWLEDAREKSQIMTRAGKVSAIMSSRYVPMPISELLETCDELQDSFGTAEFVGGSITHSMTSAKFRYPDSAPTVTKAYNEVLAAAGRSVGTIMPIIEFRSSDTTNDVASLQPILQLGSGHLLPVGEGVRVRHLNPTEKNAQGERITAMEKFRQESKTLFAKMEYDIKTLFSAMLSVRIDHPRNTFVGLCSNAKIPQKWGGQIEEDFAADWPDGTDCTFLDVYEAITQTTVYALKEYAAHSQQILDLEDKIYRIAKNQQKWKAYDYPGTVAWGKTM